MAYEVHLASVIGRTVSQLFLLLHNGFPLVAIGYLYDKREADT